MRILVSLAILSFLYGCSRPEPSAQPTAGTLSLLSAIAIPAESATVRLQYGRVTAMNAVQEQDPFCILEVEAVLPEPQTLSPGRFAVAPPRQSQESFSGMPVLLPGMISPPGRAPSQVYFKTLMPLRSSSHPVRSLACMVNAAGNPASMRPLTLTEMRQALGEQFRLELHAGRE